MLEPQHPSLRPAAPAPAAEPVLTAGGLAQYREKGWLLARGFVSPTEVATLGRWTDELAGWPEEPGRHMVYHETSLKDADARIIQRIENFCPFHAGFDGFVRGGRMLAAVSRLLGAPACLFKEKINFKLPGGAGFAPHQDQQAGWSRYAGLFVTALVTIDAATRETGCLEMDDGPRLTRIIGREWEPLDAAELAGRPLVPVPTEPGDVLFFDSYVPHGSQANLTDQPRRILYLTYNAAAEGDWRERYFAEKRASFPPDVERLPGVEYRFRV